MLHRARKCPEAPSVCDVAVAGDTLMSSWFEDRMLGIAFGVVFAFGEFGGATPFYLGSLLHKFFPSTYARITFIICE